MRFEQKTPYTHFDEKNPFPVMAIFIRESGCRFTKDKVYQLTPCSFKQNTNCTVTDDNGVVCTFTKDKTYWKLLSEVRSEKLNKLL